MIFGNNTHYNITSSSIPAAEGYDCSYGFGKMMIEGAINEYNMFEAMLAHDYQEYFAMKNGYTNEAGKDDDKSDSKASSGIMSKVAELLKKLVAKLKGILNSFIAKMMSVFGKDLEMVKKYSDQVKKHAADINKMKIKCITLENDWNTPPDVRKFSVRINKDTGDVDEDMKALAGDLIKGCTDVSDVSRAYKEKYIKETDGTIGDMCNKKGIDGVMDYILHYKSTLEKLDSDNKSTLSEINKVAADLEDIIISKDKNEDSRKAKRERLVSAWSTLVSSYMNCMLNAAKEEYKSCRAAFAKGVSASYGKVKNESTLLDAIAEAAEDEVDEVINTAIDTNDSEEIANLTAASLNVLDSDVSKDPNELVYDKVDNYTDNADMDDHEGEIDVTINSREEEANLFSEMFY